MRDTALAPLAYGLADLLTTDLARSSQLQLVDRLALDATLRELRLVETGRVDPATAPRVGRVVGARRLIVGSLAQPDGGTLGIEARVADVATTQLQQSVSATTPVADILRAEKELAFRIFDALGVRLTPAERVAVEQRQTQNLAALLAYSRGVRYELEGRLDQAAESYLGALRQDPNFERAAERLTGIRPNLLGLSRALDGAAGRLNGNIYLPTLGSAADPAFFPQSVTLILTVTTPP
jgi:TolB-like protein